MKRLFKAVSIAALTLSLVGCGNGESKFESEEAKMKEYTINTARAIEDGMNSVEMSGDPARFREVAEPYMLSFDDIDTDLLSDEMKHEYKRLQEGLYPYNGVIAGSNATMAGFHSIVEDSVIGVADFVTVAKQLYDEVDDSSEYKDLADYREER